jgi:iron-only hydrogenase group A
MQDSTCVGCGQCVLVCPTGALTQKNAIDKVMDILDEKDVITVAQVAPAVRVAIAEEFGAEIGTFAEGKMVSALKEIGFDYVFDVNMGADFTVVEEAQELIEKLQSKKDLPLFTSCCPAWFNYCEKFYPEFKHHLSSSKSPNEMLGSLVKYYFESQGKKVKIVSIMPCTAKKREIISHGVIDKSITTRELGQLIKLKGIDFNSLEDSSFDNPFGESTGGALIFGVTGGVTEAALRYAIFKLTGKKQDVIEDVRYSDGVKEVTVDLNGKKVNLAIVHGLSNAPKVIDAIKSGEKHYDFVEVMACPGGCVNGGGQSFVDYNKVDVEEVIRKRGEAIYKADGNMKFRSSEDNASVATIYKDLLKDDKHLIHELLHYIHTED